MNGPHESCNKLSSRVGQVSLESSRLDPGRDDVCAHINMIYTYTIYIYRSHMPTSHLQDGCCSAANRKDFRRPFFKSDSTTLVSSPGTSGEDV